MPKKTPISELTELVTVANGDFVPVVDVSDTSESAAGTTKRCQASNLPGGVGGGIAWSDPVDADIVPDGVLDRDLGSSVTPFAEVHLTKLLGSEATPSASGDAGSLGMVKIAGNYIYFHNGTRWLRALGSAF